jgi:predicted dehydrogenase
MRIGVLGAGHMGRRHAQKIVELAESDPGISLRAVIDIDGRRASRLGRELGARTAFSLTELRGQLDAVIVAVPTVSHFEVVRQALAFGLDVLVEKPVAATLDEGEEILALARRARQVLHVGHVEWFNPAMPILRRYVGTPRYVEAHRLGPFPSRSLDVDVVRDLMIHDLDILQRLLGEEPDEIEAVGVRVLSDQVDVANARVRFPSGCVGNFTASRVAASPVRRLRLFHDDGFLSIDFLARSAWLARRAEPGEDGAESVFTEELKVDPEDALLSQLRSFVDAVRLRKVDCPSAGEALGALRTALRVVDAMPSVPELH